MSREGKVDNLKPFRTVEEARENGKKGGIASGETRRQQKTFRQIAENALKGRIKSEKIKKQFSTIGVISEGDPLTGAEAVIGGQMAAAIKGSTMAADWLKNLTEPKDEAPKEELPLVKIPAEEICGAFCDLNRHISNGKVEEAIIKGGRGGWKSSYIGEKMPELIMNNPSIHGLALRSVKDTLRDSVYEQIKWGIELLGVSDRFKCTTSPLMITYLPTGQHIYFRGADDPAKIKSIKPPFGYIGVVWFEEFDQFAGAEAVRKIKQSAIRGTDRNGESKTIVFETYNPPPTAQSWVNQYVADIEARQNDPEKRKNGTEVLTVSYKDVPEEWLGKAFIAEAEELKKINERAYRNEYLGEVTGTGGQVFENLEIRTITDEEIGRFDRIRQGIDWGWYPDPTAFVRVYYDKARMIVYIFDERKRNKTGNEELAVLLSEFKDVQTIADSAENKTIDFFIGKGYKMRGAKKPAGSVEYGMKWLASRAKIVIDRARCPETAKEFENSEFLKDKDGNYISGYPDKDNHFQDAVRYALNDEIMDNMYTVKGGVSRLR